MTSNPMLRQNTAQEIVFDSKPMSAQGAINKTGILLAIVVAVGAYCWHLCASGFSDKAMLLATIGAIMGFILALVTFFKPNTSHITAPAYAICEGALVGAVSFMYNSAYQGIVLNAIFATLAALFSMLFLYKTRIIQATPKFRKVIVVSTIGIAVFYLAGIIGAFLGHPMTIFNGSIVGIGVSLAICVIAALNFILDFDFFERAEGRLPDYYEWYAGLSLLVTVIWLYFEILRLLAQLNSRR